MFCYVSFKLFPSSFFVAPPSSNLLFIYLFLLSSSLSSSLRCLPFSLILSFLLHSSSPFPIFISLLFSFFVFLFPTFILLNFVPPFVLHQLSFFSILTPCFFSLFVHSTRYLHPLNFSFLVLLTPLCSSSPSSPRILTFLLSPRHTLSHAQLSHCLAPITPQHSPIHPTFLYPQPFTS